MITPHRGHSVNSVDLRGRRSPRFCRRREATQSREEAFGPVWDYVEGKSPYLPACVAPLPTKFVGDVETDDRPRTKRV